VFHLGGCKLFTEVQAAQRLRDLHPTFGVFSLGITTTQLSILGLPNVCALEKSIFCCLLLGFPFSTGGWGGSSSGCRGDADMLKANACGQ
jgi:hypothetical protein